MKIKLFTLYICLSSIISFFVYDSLRSNTKCSTGDISLNPVDGYILIYKSASQSARFPSGYLLFTTLINDREGNYIKNEKLVKKIEIIGPDGNIFKTFNNRLFQPMGTESSGYEVFTINSYKRWKGYDIAYNGNNLPKGSYFLRTTSVSGVLKSSMITFRGDRDLIKGFPTNIKYNVKTRKITWNGTTGQTGYRVILFKGVKSTSIECDNIVYFSGFKKGNLVKGNSFVLPKGVFLESGKQYFIVVAAHDSEDNTSEKMNYLHFQDDQNEIAVFTAP